MKRIIAILIAASLIMTGCGNGSKSGKQLDEEECVKRLEAVCEEYGYELEKYEAKMITEYEAVNRNPDLRLYTKVNDDNRRVITIILREYGDKGKICFDLEFMRDLFDSVAEHSVNVEDMETAISKLRSKIESPGSKYPSEQRKIKGNGIMLCVFNQEPYLEELSICGEVIYLD